MTCCPLVPPTAATAVMRLIQPGSARSSAGSRAIALKKASLAATMREQGDGWAAGQALLMT